MNLKWNVDRFMYTISYEEDPSHELELPKVSEGELHTTQFAGSFNNNSSIGYGIGSIAVMLYTKQRESEPNTTDPSYANNTTLKNRLRGSDGGIKPNYELTLAKISDNIRRDNQTKHLREAKDERPGLYPLVTFIFHYRSHDAIRQAGCTLAPLDDHAIPAIPGHQPALTTTEQTGANTSAQQQRKTRYSTVGLSTPATMAKEKKKLFGQPLPPPSRRSTTLGLSNLDVYKDGTAPPSKTPARAFKSAHTAAAPATQTKKRSHGLLARFPLAARSDSEGDDDAAPPPPKMSGRARKSAPTAAGPSTRPAKSGRGSSARSPVFVQSDGESDEDVRPSLPKKFMGPRKSAPSLPSLSPPPMKRSRGPSARSQLFIQSESESDNDVAPLLSESELRAREPCTAPVVPAMMESNGIIYRPDASQDGAASKRKRTLDVAA